MTAIFQYICSDIFENTARLINLELIDNTLITDKGTRGKNYIHIQ